MTPLNETKTIMNGGLYTYLREAGEAGVVGLDGGGDFSDFLREIFKSSSSGPYKWMWFNDRTGNLVRIQDGEFSGDVSEADRCDCIAYVERFLAQEGIE